MAARSRSTMGGSVAREALDGGPRADYVARMFLTRRAMLRSAAATCALTGSGCASTLANTLFWRDQPPRHPPPGTRAFVRRMFGDLDRRRVWDAHAHVLADGGAGSGGYVNPRFTESYGGRLEKALFLASGGIVDDEKMEEHFVERTLSFWRLTNPQGKIVLLAFDQVVDDQGQEVPAQSTFYTPNEWVANIAKNNADVLFAASVHPYRKDALDRLNAAHEMGAVAMKWLPNSQAIDTRDPRCKPLYRRLAELGLPLIVHAGEEQAAASVDEDAGNPLRLRHALDEGCRVVVAHAAGLGEAQDLDGSGSMAAYDLFRRMLDESQYQGRLFADISAMTQFNRTGDALNATIRDQQVHQYLINGSDYPLPAIDFLVSTRWLEKLGYLSAEDRIQCNRVFEVNPLLFDFCVKRALRYEEDGVVHKFSDIVFESARLFDPPAA